MRLETGMRAGRESLMTHGTALNTIADNLANVNTTGYKDSRLEFADLVGARQGSLFGGPIQTGNGVTGTDIFTMHSIQGSVELTGRNLDAAIEGQGWFIVQEGEDTYYTRAGNFVADQEGFLVTPTGGRVLGYTADNADVPVPINVRGVVGNPEATANIALGGNLDAVSPLVGEIPAAGATFRDMAEASSYTTSVRVVDSLGGEQTVSLFFYRTDNLTWAVQAAVDGESVGGEAGVPVIIGNGQLQVGPNGLQAEDAEALLELAPAWAGGAEQGNIALDLRAFTGFANASTISEVTVDGLRGGAVLGVSIDNNGNVSALLDSGETIETAQLALATFNSPEGLTRAGNNIFRISDASGEAQVGRAGQDGFGKVLGGSLENSTVDQAKQFVSLIQFQQGYRAGSQVIQTMSELITQTIQLA